MADVGSDYHLLASTVVREVRGRCPGSEGPDETPKPRCTHGSSGRGGTETRGLGEHGPGPKGVGFGGLLPNAETGLELRCPLCVSFGAVDLADHLVPDPEVLVHRRHGPLRVVVPDRLEDRYVYCVHPVDAVGSARTP